MLLIPGILITATFCTKAKYLHQVHLTSGGTEVLINKVLLVVLSLLTYSCCNRDDYLVDVRSSPGF